MTQGKYSELPVERVMAALDGDRKALTELYHCYDPTVRIAVVLVLRYRPQVADQFEDIVAEVWTRHLADGCRRLRSFDPTRGVFGYYLRMLSYAGARVVAGQYLRRAQTVEMADLYHSTFGRERLEGRVLGRDELAKLDRAVREHLSEDALVLFDQVLVLGRSIPEVAEELGIPPNAAYRRCHRLKDKIAKIARDLGVVGPGTQPTHVLALLIAFSAQSEVLSIEKNSMGVSELGGRIDREIRES